MCIGRAIRLEQRHPAAAARDQHGGRRVRASSSRPAFSSTRRFVADPDAEQLLDLRLVGRAGRHAAVAQQRVARIDEHRRLPYPVRANCAVARRDDRRRDQPGAVVGHQQRVARAPPPTRASTRWRARSPPTAPPRARDRSARPAASPSARRPRGCASWSACDSRAAARYRAASTPAPSASIRRCPVSSGPATPIADGVPPSAATFFAALPAPPGTISVES